MAVFIQNCNKEIISKFIFVFQKVFKSLGYVVYEIFTNHRKSHLCTPYSENYENTNLPGYDLKF